MSRKRSIVSTAFNQRKRICATVQNGENATAWEIPAVDTDENSANFTETKQAFITLLNMFPAYKFQQRLPPIIMQHQLFSIVKDEQKCHQQLDMLRASKEVMLLRCSFQQDLYCLVPTLDYRHHILQTCCQQQPGHNRFIIDKFLSSVLPHTQFVFHKQSFICDFRFTEEDITQLVKLGVLYDYKGDCWLTIPNINQFTKTFNRGRKAVLTMIKKCKYNAILEKDLQSRKLPKIAKLGMTYHIHDVVGAGLVQSLPTSEGRLLRINDT